MARLLARPSGFALATGASSASGPSSAWRPSPGTRRSGSPSPGSARRDPAGLPRASASAAIGVVAAVSLAVFAPWAVRNWLVFGTPLPGQALANALSVTGFDIFAWQDQPTLERYLALGPARLARAPPRRARPQPRQRPRPPRRARRPSIGLARPAAAARRPALRPLLLYRAITFAATSLLFPVATTWGTFLHAAGPVHVLLVVAALLGLDRLLAAVGRRRGWTRPVAWLGPTLDVSALAPLQPRLPAGLRCPGGEPGAAVRAIEAAFARARDAPRAGPGESGPVITNFPIWLAYATDAPALALPDEPPAAVLDLAAAFPGTRYLVVVGDEHGRWPGVLEGGGGASDPAVACFRRLDLAAALPAEADALAEVRAWEMACVESADR
ncbi:MAG: hypothetical protein KatS3mg065_0867 [Chloroflexota bacterium]|nr:MAG: hypothetical protein KatS3mg065_0867 [Chloroflexota bacterium]